MTTDNDLTLEQLVSIVELEDIVFYEVAGSRRDGFQSKGDEIPETPQTDARILQRLTGSVLEVRCRTRIDAADAKYLVDLAARFSVPEGAAVPDEVSAEFIRRVGLMALHPYIRESVSQLSSKLRVDHLTLSLLRPEQALIEKDSDQAL